MKTKIKHKFLCERSIFRVNYTALIIVSFVFFLYQLVCVLQVEKLQILILFIICLRFQNFTLRFFGRLFWRCAALFFSLSLCFNAFVFLKEENQTPRMQKEQREACNKFFIFFFQLYKFNNNKKSIKYIFNNF